MIDITNINDYVRIDRELDHLSSLDLIGSGIGGGGILLDEKIIKADITPRPITIQLYVRCQGYVGSPKEYFGL